MVLWMGRPPEGLLGACLLAMAGFQIKMRAFYFVRPRESKMVEIEEIFINGKLYRFESFVGTVVEANRERETRITGSGGGGYSFDGYGSTDPIKIQSETVVHKDFFLVDEQGYERHLGHQLQMLGAVTKNADAPILLGLNNRNLAQFEWMNGPIGRVASSYHAWMYPLAWVASFALAYAAGSWKVFFGVMVPARLLLFWKTRRIEKQIWQQLDKMAMNRAKWDERYPKDKV